MTITIDQRAIDLVHAGRGADEVANLLHTTPQHVQSLIQTLTNAATGLGQPTSIQQRAVDLAYAGHGVPEIAALTKLTENQVRAALQDTTKTPQQASTPLAGLSSTTAPSAGGAGALPATPKGYLQVLVNGTARQIPYY